MIDFLILHTDVDMIFNIFFCALELQLNSDQKVVFMDNDYLDA